jgi:hypothetical protein
MPTPTAADEFAALKAAFTAGTSDDDVIAQFTAWASDSGLSVTDAAVEIEAFGILPPPQEPIPQWFWDWWHGLLLKIPVILPQMPIGP